MKRRGLTLALAVLTAGSSLAFAGIAAAGSGGVGTGEQPVTTADTSYQKVQFGQRDLRRGNRGDDVKTLHWLLLAQPIGNATGTDFVGKTESAVRKFQAQIGVSQTGIVKKSTRKGFAKRMANCAIVM